MDVPAEVLYARIGRLTVECDFLRNRLAAADRAMKEMDAEVQRLKPFEAEAAGARETLQELEGVNRALKAAWESTQVAPPKPVPFVEIPATNYLTSE